MTITHHDFNKIAKGKREAPFSLRLTFDERAKLEAAANGVPLAAYIKAKLFDGELSQHFRLSAEDTARQAIRTAHAMHRAGKNAPECKPQSTKRDADNNGGPSPF